MDKIQVSQTDKIVQKRADKNRTDVSKLTSESLFCHRDFNASMEGDDITTPAGNWFQIRHYLPKFTHHTAVLCEVKWSY